MDLKTWINGIDLYLEHIIQLRDDGKLLLEHGSNGHAYFSFSTAIEESAMIDFIIFSLYIPKPEEIKKCFHHRKKRPYAVNRILKGELSFEELSNEDLIKLLPWRQPVLSKLEPEIFESSREFIMGNLLIKQKDLRKLRNNSIYLDISDDNERWITPKEIEQDKAEFLLNRLDEEIKRLKGTIESLHKNNSEIYSI